MADVDTSIANFTRQRNAEKQLFTAGPASLLPANLTGLMPCFGRGDEHYLQVEQQVLEQLKAMSGHSQIVRMQGSASLALEMVARNFLRGRVLIVDSGYYSERLHSLSAAAQRTEGEVSQLDRCAWDELENISGQYDWIYACYTETSCALRIPIELLSQTAQRLGARLALDATASIGLESGHERADVIAYSSCKGLFGLTGAAFIAYRDDPQVEPDSFYLRLSSHVSKMMTGPYHSIASLADVLPHYDDHKAAVLANKAALAKRFESYLTVEASLQPALCTHISCVVESANRGVVLYKPRSNLGGSVICHLGEAHLGRAAKGAILDLLEIQS
ncbi:MAG: hypothetical protein AAGI11_08015 [Pseudomonadota bacterium]